MGEFIQRHSLIAMTTGLLLWSLFFLFCYGFLSIGCALGWGDQQVRGWNLIHLVLWMMTGFTLLLLAFLTRPAWRLTARGRRVTLDGPRNDRMPGAPPSHEEASREWPTSGERDRFAAILVLLVNLLAAIGVIYVAAPFLMKIPPCVA